MSTLKEEALQLHKVHQGKLAVSLKVDIETKHDLSLAYSAKGISAVLAWGLLKSMAKGVLPV